MPGPDTPVRRQAHGIHEAALQRQALAALPQLWAAVAQAMRKEANPGNGTAHPQYAYGYADAMESCIRQLSAALLTDDDIFQLARGLVAKYMHPSRLGHPPTAGEAVVQVETDTALALFARRAHEQALLAGLEEVPEPPQVPAEVAMTEQEALAAVRDFEARLRAALPTVQPDPELEAWLQHESRSPDEKKEGQ